MITGLQIRAARAALGWSATELAKRSSIAMKTVARLEQSNGIPPSHSSTLHEIKKTLEAAGVEFIGAPDDAPGIRVRLPKK